MKAKRVWPVYLAVALLLAAFWVLSLWSQDYTHDLYFNPHLQSGLYLLPILAGLILGCCMKTPESRLWAVPDVLLALLMLPFLFPFYTVSLAGVGKLGQSALAFPLSMRGICAILCGVLLGQTVQLLRPRK